MNKGVVTEFDTGGYLFMFSVSGWLELSHVTRIFEVLAKIAPKGAAAVSDRATTYKSWLSAATAGKSAVCTTTIIQCVFQ
jgi:predicted transcriptional regulator